MCSVRFWVMGDSFFSDVAKTGEKILRFFSRLRPSISYDPGDNSWSGTLDAVKSGETDHTPLLVEAIDGITAVRVRRNPECLHRCVAT